MKVYITVDMEGATSVTQSDQLWAANRYGASQEIREIITRDVNAAIEGAFQGGATEIVVNENHSGRELIPELLDRRAVAFLGKPKFLMTGEGLEGFDSHFLLGLHPRVGTLDGIMDHTWIAKAISDFRVNGESTGEIGLNAYLAGHYGIPVPLVSGCQAACDEAKHLLGDVETVAVKKGHGRFAAYCLHPGVVRERIQAAAEKVMIEHRRFRPLKVKTPVTIDFDLFTQQQALMCMLVPGSKRTGVRAVRFVLPDFLEVMKIFVLIGTVVSSATDESPYFV